MPTDKTPITVAHGDGIGPEIMAATLEILEAGGAELAIETIEVGEKLYESGFSSGIRPDSWESIHRTGVLLKAPITTPQGGGVKSLNVTIRKTLALFANVRPSRAYHPYIRTHFPDLDLVIVRENEEDLYTGIEHRQTDDVVQCLKLISRPGCERIVRYAFEYARKRPRRKLTCMSKDNIMKMTDGLFHRVFNEVAAEYPDVETEHMIIDIGMARVADTPERFDVIVTLNLYGDILSDIVGQISGSVGVGGSANIGEKAAMFEAIHGSAPDIAGKGVANPSGLLLAGVKMLEHIGQSEAADRVQKAWLKTIEDGVHTGDLYRPELSKRRVGTAEFAEAVIERMGEEPSRLPVSHYPSVDMRKTKPRRTRPAAKALVGVDVFLHVRWDQEGDPNELAAGLLGAPVTPLRLDSISSRGLKIWPDGAPETVEADHCRCRFLADRPGRQLTHQDIAVLLARLAERGFDFIKTEHLYEFDGQRGYSLAQGQ
ncbi:MAG: NADP-dependent isocitrate dehydrogenase [Acidobacteria bacterium]|nr:NADP-dependent isocitrate dehydrogenase [Acidobacteriota bacterium]